MSLDGPMELGSVEGVRGQVVRGEKDGLRRGHTCALEQEGDTYGFLLSLCHVHV